MKLTPREKEVLGLLAEGKSRAEMAALLGISAGTAKRHISNLGNKTGLGRCEELGVWWAMGAGRADLIAMWVERLRAETRRHITRQRQESEAIVWRRRLLDKIAQ